MNPTLEPFSSDLLWIVVFAFIISFFLAFGIGANDVANSFGTSVGSGVLTLKQACTLATIFEILGAVTLGYQVSSTIRLEMIDVSQFDNQTKLLATGYLSSLIGGAIWNLAATFLGLPVSGTHSIVGAIVGFAIVSKGFDSVRWMSIIKIVASWFISPVTSGFLSVVVFIFILHFILKKEKPLESGLCFLPLFYGLTTFVIFFSITFESPNISSYYSDWIIVAIIFACTLLVSFFIWLVIVPCHRQVIIAKTQLSNINDETRILIPKETSSYTENTKVSISTNQIVDTTSDQPEVVHLFSYLQIMTACFGSFAHGANDVSNSIGPLVSVVLLYLDGTTDQSGDTPWYILLYGGIGMSIGLWIWGRRVIKTMGQDLTKVTPSTGFSIEIGAAFTVLLASKIGLPISTTHCKVGSVVMVGRVRDQCGVDWGLFRNIIIAWLLTVPVSAIFSGAAMALLQWFGNVQ